MAAKRNVQRWGAPVRRLPLAGRGRAAKLGLVLTPGMKVGLFGGSFNPAHEGHRHVAQTALKRLDLDRLIWLVSPQNPLKSADETASLAQRMQSARAFAGRREQVSDAETRLGVAYTIDTVRLFRARYPGVHFVWIMGSDNLAGFHRWRGWSDLFHTLPIAVVSRPNALVRSRVAPAAQRFAGARIASRGAALLALKRAPAWTFLRAPLNPVSSTQIRARNSSAPSPKG